MKDERRRNIVKNVKEKRIDEEKKRREGKSLWEEKGKELKEKEKKKDKK